MNKVTLLLVDDHLAFINSAIRELRKFSWIEIVGTATNGRDAITECERLKPAAVLMDMQMPGIGGVQATRAIKAQDNPPFVVITSHFDDLDHVEHARKAADEFVSKVTYVQAVLPILERLRDRASADVA